jgi:hypothetical protein
VAAVFLLAVASEWVQLPTVEPGGKLKFKPRLRGNEEGYQIQSPEANRRTDETQIKAETKDPKTNFASEGTSHTVTHHFTVNIENDDSGTQIYNTELNLNHDDPVLMPSIPNSDYSKPDSHDTTKNNYGSQKSEETVTFIQPPHKLPFESVLETEASDIKTPEFKVHLTTSNLNTPNFQPRRDLKVTTMHVDAKLPNPGIHDRPPDVKDSTSKFSDSFYETNSAPYPTVKKNNGNPEEIITIMKPNDSSIDAESGTLWTSRTGNSHNETEENTVQDAGSPLDMLKAVHETLIEETPHTITGKMHFLQQLKVKILHYMGKVILLYSTLYVKLFMKCIFNIFIA